MSTQYRTVRSQQQVAQAKSDEVAQELERYLAAPLERLDAYIDRRLVKTFVQAIRAIIALRNQAPGLTISELGSYITNGAQAPAGGKRLHNLLASEKWSEEIFKVFLWNEAKHCYEILQKEGEQVLVVWDGSVLEKPESQKAQDLCAVKSSKAARKKKSRKGSFNQPGGKPIVVLGREWSACVVTGLRGKPALAMMEFWSRKGKGATRQKAVEGGMLRVAAVAWGKNVWHVFDRGYAAGWWIELLGTCGMHFLIRWKKGHHFCDEQGVEKSLAQIGKTKRSWGYRMIRDGRTNEVKKTGIVAVPVRHTKYAGPLWVVIVRRGGEPWYLATNIPVETEEQAWKCYKAYCRRWQIETVFRYEKSELAIETIRVWKQEKLQKLLQMIAVVHAFLLHLLDENTQGLVQWILHHYCHRTGKKQREAKIPLYRLRWGLSRLWQEFRPSFSFAPTVRAQPDSYPGSNMCSVSSG